MDNETTEEELPRLPKRGGDRKTHPSETTSPTEKIIKHAGLPKSSASWLVAVGVLGFAYSQFSSFTKTISDVAKSSVESEFVRRENEALKEKENQCLEDKKQVQSENQRLLQKIERLETELKQENWWSPKEREKLK